MGIVYQIRNRINGEHYIGKTVGTMEDRRHAHEKNALNGSGLLFQNALCKYGFDAFEWKIIMVCDDEVDLNESEIVCIRMLRTKVPSGYNLTDGGEGCSGFYWKHTENWKRAVSFALIGRKKTPEHLANISRALTGRKLSPEHAEKARKARLGKKDTLETIEKKKRASTGRKHTDDAKCKMSEAKKGKPSALRGRTYDEIYGNRAGHYRSERSKKRKVNQSLQAKAVRNEGGKKAAQTRKKNGTDGTKLIAYNGRAQGLHRWAEEFGVNHGTLWSRLDRGWSFAKAIATKNNGSRSQSQRLRRMREREMNFVMEAE